MDERILDLLSTLATIQRELGPAVYDDAVERARLGAAVAAHIEAERRSLRHRRLQRSGNVVIFPGTAGGDRISREEPFDALD